MNGTFKTEPCVFRDRVQAATRLAKLLANRSWHDPVVMAIPRGGVVLGAVLAHELDADLDVVLARKLRAPGREELAIGALAEGGDVVLNPELQDYLATIPTLLAREVRIQRDEIARRAALYRAARPPVSVTGRSVIVADDGIATGSTMIAALRTFRAQQPLELVVAVPVAPAFGLSEIEALCDELICLARPNHFEAVGQFYTDFTQIDDEEVTRLLDGARTSASVASVSNPPPKLSGLFNHHG